MTSRRAFLATVGAAGAAGAVGFQGAIAASSAADPLLESVLAEMIPLHKRALADPGNREHMLEFASMLRLADAVTTAHDLKRSLRSVRPIAVDSSVMDHMATKLRAHGVKATGDDLLRHHFEQRNRLQDAEGAERAIAAAVADGTMFQQSAALFAALGAASAGVSGVAFRERLRGQEFDLLLRKTMPAGCGSGLSGSADTWAFFFDFTGILLLTVPPLAPLGVVYSVLGVVLGGYWTYCSQG